MYENGEFQRSLKVIWLWKLNLNMLLTTWKLFIKSSRPRIILTHAIAKNIPQHQQFVESLAKLLEPIRIPSSVLTFAVIRSLASRPWDKGGGGEQSQKRFYSALWASVWYKNKRGRAGSATGAFTYQLEFQIRSHRTQSSTSLMTLPSAQ